MPVPVGRRARSTVNALAALAVLAVPGCSRPPTAEEGRAKLVGAYQFFDLRQPATDVNPAFKNASLLLRADGTAVQTCEYKDGTKYESSGMTWVYRGDGNVHLSPLKDCSWVYGDLLEPREGSVERPRGGASLIVEWGRKPNIVMHPDRNAFYEWQERPK